MSKPNNIISFISKLEKNGDYPNYLKYFDSTGDQIKFRHIWLAEDILNNHCQMFYDGMNLHRYSDGSYISDGTQFFKKLCQELLEEESNRSRIEEALYWVKNETYIDPSKNINPNDGLINVKNGLLNYKTGELLPHNRERLSTIQFPVHYDPKANDPIIMEFIKSIVPEDTIETILELIGYCLVPTTKYEKAVMLTGSGANGKSTLVNMISALLGKGNVSNVPLQELENNRFKSAQLYGKMANIFADLPNLNLNKSNIFKSIVTGDSISAEFKGKDSFDFRPFAKLIFSANEIPSTQDITDGFFRRWILIPFPNKFTPDKADPNLSQKLTTPQALSTLLNYAIQGLNRLETNHHFTEGETISAMLEQYKKESDTVKAYIDDNCIIGWGDLGYSISTVDLFESYEKWCKENGYQFIGKKKFNQRLQQDYNLNKSRKYGQSSEHWENITLKQ